jgi:hypothetical protein
MPPTIENVTVATAAVKVGTRQRGGSCRRGTRQWRRGCPNWGNSSCNSTLTARPSCTPAARAIAALRRCASRTARLAALGRAASMARGMESSLGRPGAATRASPVPLIVMPGAGSSWTGRNWADAASGKASAVIPTTRVALGSGRSVPPLQYARPPRGGPAARQSEVGASITRVGAAGGAAAAAVPDRRASRRACADAPPLWPEPGPRSGRPRGTAEAMRLRVRPLSA